MAGLGDGNGDAIQHREGRAWSDGTCPEAATVGELRGLRGRDLELLPGKFLDAPDRFFQRLLGPLDIPGVGLGELLLNL